MLLIKLDKANKERNQTTKKDNKVTIIKSINIIDKSGDDTHTHTYTFILLPKTNFYIYFLKFQL